ncbi:hypothetical protein [Agrobacterium pusense]|uniref:hypothetical protein n=1 Tax=Agrobacterium pusense TaxID=648995 RepID=UPI00289C152A|nr:hypothetical protein [Agrobacterium pusense]
MTALEEIKKAEHERIWLEPAGAPDRCWCQDNQWGDDGVEYFLASALESLRRENEALKKDRDFWKEQFQVETRYRIELADRGTLLALTDANSRAEAAEAEVKRYRVALIAAKTRMRNCRGAIESDQVVDKDVHGSLGNGIRDIQEALASTGGEHHAE